MEKDSLIFYQKEEQFLVLKLTKDFKFYLEQKMKLGLLDQTLQEKGAKNITKWVKILKLYIKYLGCRFAKWRAVLKIEDGCPSD